MPESERLTVHAFFYWALKCLEKICTNGKHLSFIQKIKTQQEKRTVLVNLTGISPTAHGSSRARSVLNAIATDFVRPTFVEY